MDTKTTEFEVMLSVLILGTMLAMARNSFRDSCAGGAFGIGVVHGGACIMSSVCTRT